jgi:Fe2+ transport system protein FeoA
VSFGLKPTLVREFFTALSFAKGRGESPTQTGALRVRPKSMKFVKGQSFDIKGFDLSAPENPALAERLQDLGLRVGQKVFVCEVLGGGQVVVVHFEKTLVALNSAEVACLKL